MENARNVNSIFKKAKNKYKNAHYLKNYFDYFPVKGAIDVLYFKSATDNRHINVYSYLKKNCKDKFYFRVIPFKTKMVGFKSRKIISEIDIRQPILYYVYYKNHKDMMMIKLKRNF